MEHRYKKIPRLRGRNDKEGEGFVSQFIEKRLLTV